MPKSPLSHPLSQDTLPLSPSHRLAAAPRATTPAVPRLSLPSFSRRMVHGEQSKEPRHE